MNGIKRRKDDILFSQYLRSARDYTCERCGKVGLSGKGLEVSHYFGRRRESVRFDPDNVSVLCHGCHRYFHENPPDYYAFQFRKLGKRKYNALTIRANTPTKKDVETNVKMIREWIQNGEGGEK